MNKINWSKRTLSRWDNLADRWAKFANGRNLDPRLMIAWHQFVIATNTTPNEIRRHHLTIKRLIGWMRQMGAITHDPTIVLPKIRVTSKPATKFWTHEEYLKVVEWANEKPEHQTHLWLIVLGYHTGMSLRDCCLLKWSEVEFRDDGPCYIHRIRGKLESRLGRKAMFFVPIVPGSELWLWFKRMQKSKVTGPVDYVHQDAAAVYLQFADKFGSTFSNRIVSVFAAALGKDAIQKRSFRNLRQSFCSRLLNSGADAVLVSKMTGHQNLQQLSEYVVPNIRAMEEAVVRAIRWAEGEQSRDGIIKLQSV